MYQEFGAFRTSLYSTKLRHRIRDLRLARREWKLQLYGIWHRAVY